MNAYVRTRGGRIIHRATCARLGSARAAPWNWAEGKTPAQIRFELQQLGLPVQFCGHCIGTEP